MRLGPYDLGLGLCDLRLACDLALFSDLVAALRLRLLLRVKTLDVWKAQLITLHGMLVGDVTRKETTKRVSGSVVFLYLLHA